MQQSKLSTRRSVAILALGIIVATAALTLARQGKPKSLYDRLGGYEAISAVVEDFAPKLFNDPKIGRFFVGMSDDTKGQFKQKNKNLVCNVTGGPCQVISRSAKQAHAGLGINEDDFNIVVKHLVDTLNKFKVPDAEQKELLAIIGSLKKDIVEKK